MTDCSPIKHYTVDYISNSEQETINLGERVANMFCEGSVVALRGVLGSGKTHFVKGIAVKLRITETITSPTYTIINEYKSYDNIPFYHIDAYRLNSEEEFEQIGGSEIINGKGISVIEWSERISKLLPKETITISIKITGPSSRFIQVSYYQKEYLKRNIVKNKIIRADFKRKR